MKYNVFRTQIFQPATLTFPMGILDILEVGNRDLKTLIIQIEIRWFFDWFVEKAAPKHCESMLFWTRFSFLKISSIPIGKVNILETENRVLKTLYFIDEIIGVVYFLQLFDSNSLWIHAAFERDFRFPEKQVFQLEKSTF